MHYEIDFAADARLVLSRRRQPAPRVPYRPQHAVVRVADGAHWRREGVVNGSNERLLVVAITVVVRETPAEIARNIVHAFPVHVRHAQSTEAVQQRQLHPAVERTLDGRAGAAQQVVRGAHVGYGGPRRREVRRDGAGATTTLRRRRQRYPREWVRHDGGLGDVIRRRRRLNAGARPAAEAWDQRRPRAAVGGPNNDVLLDRRHGRRGEAAAAEAVVSHGLPQAAGLRLVRFLLRLQARYHLDERVHLGLGTQRQAT